MIGQLAKLNKDITATIVGTIAWGYDKSPYHPIIRYYWVTLGERDKDGNRIDLLRKPEDVTILK